MKDRIAAWRIAKLHAYLEYVSRTSVVAVKGDFDSRQVLAMWHEHIYLALVACHSIKGVAVYVWKHPQAAFSAALIRSCGMHVIEGSEENLYGRRTVTAWLSGAADRKLVVAVDGPWGPRRVAKRGALLFAGLAGVSLRALTFSAVGVHRLPTWDDRCVPESGLRLTMSNESEILPGTCDARHNLERVLRLQSLTSSPQLSARALAGRCWVRACAGPHFFGRATFPGISQPE